jgi:hypothetical protein
VASLAPGLVLILTAASCVSPSAPGRWGEERPPGERQPASGRSDGKARGGPEVLSWPSDLWRFLVKRADEAGAGITNAIFETFDEFDLVTLPVGASRLKLVSRRQVFDNFDLLNTWTVIDRFVIQSGTPLIALSTPVPLPLGPIPGGIEVGVRLGGNLGLAWTNVRQVRATTYRELPLIEEEARRIESSEWFGALRVSLDRSHMLRADPSPVPDAASLEAPTPPNDSGLVLNSEVSGPFSAPTAPDGEPEKPENPAPSPRRKRPRRDRLSGLDPALRPRVSRFFNRFLFPGRLPMTVEAFRKLAPGELLAYTAFGELELGANVGWTLLPDPVLAELGAKASFRSFLRGEFVVSVLKESENHAKVKVSRVKRRGAEAGFRVGAKSRAVHEGFVLFDGIESGPLWLEAVPFSLDHAEIDSGWFDVGYRYDLRHPEAAEAYALAVRGLLARSAELEGVGAAGGEAVVTRLFDRTAEERSRTSRAKLGLGLYRWRSSAGQESVRAEVRLPDGSHRLLKEVSFSEKRKSPLWGGSEGRRFQFTVAAREGGSEAALGGSEKPGLVLVAETEFHDARTNGKELRRYIREVENAVGRPGVFPELPVYLPRDSAPVAVSPDGTEKEPLDEAEEDGEKKPRTARYGRTSFYYGFRLDGPKLARFVGLSDEAKREALGKVWRVFHPHDGVAHSDDGVVASGAESDKPRPSYRGLLREWLALRPDAAVGEQLERLGELFSERGRGRELLALLGVVFEGQELDYFVTAQGAAFGRIQLRGKVLSALERFLDLTDRELGFERQAGGFRGDDLAVVTQLRGRRLEDGRVEISFLLGSEARLLAFKLARVTRWKRYRVLAELAYSNAAGRFRPGFNTLILDPLAPDLLGRELGRALGSDELYQLSLGISRDGARWGPAAVARFRARAGE